MCYLTYRKKFIKDLDLLFANITNQKNDFEELENKLSDFYKFLCLIKENINIKTTSDNQEQQTNEDLTTNNFVYKMGKEIFNILEKTLNKINSNSINPLESSENTSQPIDILAINNKSLPPISYSNQTGPSTSK